MATTATLHSHAPQGFIRKYIFSLDHKVIGLQYFFLALTAVWVGMFLSLLMRIHLVWPGVHLALLSSLGGSPDRFAALTTLHVSLMILARPTRWCIVGLANSACRM